MAGVGNQVKRAGTLGDEWTLLKNVKGEKMGRRVPMLLAAMAVMVALFAAAAYAAQIEGTDRNETINESNLNDKIAGKDGVDRLIANNFNRAQVAEAGNPRGDRDRLSGGRHADFLEARDGDARDVLDGGKGWDECWGDVDIVDATTDPDKNDDRFVNCEVENGVAAVDE
jgi:hypothetical protein